MRHLSLVALLTFALASACTSEDANPQGDVDSGDSSGADAGTSTPPDASTVPPDAGRPDASCTPPTFDAPTPANFVPAVIVTRNSLKPVFDRLAALHTVLGTPTDVITIETICAGGKCVDSDPKRDTVKAIKDYLRSRSLLKYALLGGGIDIVPSRSVYDSYSNSLAGYSFEATFLTDFYYSDFSEWDSNGDGVYADDGADQPAYLPDIAVSRIPVHTVDEAETYLSKVVHHLTAFDQAKVKKALAMTNIAMQQGMLNIDSAWYIDESQNGTLTLLPSGFEVTKLYATLFPYAPTAGSYTEANEQQALMDGNNLVVHSGHAGNDYVTIEIDGTEPFWGSDAYAMTNSTLPIFLSCGCEAGDYSVAYHAGEELLLAPSGGAIAYLGNAPVGLGLAGGMQMIDELLRYVQTSGDGTLLGDAYFHAHSNLPKNASFKVPYIGISVPVVDQDSYEWTQKGVVLFGDELIPVWTEPRNPAPTFFASKAPVCEGTRITIVLSDLSTGTMRVQTGTSVYQLSLNNQGSVSLTVHENPSKIFVGFSSPQSLYGFAEISL